MLGARDRSWRVGLALAALLLAGCTGSDPGADPSPTAAPSGSIGVPDPGGSAGEDAWSVPGLVDAAGTAIQVPTPGPATGDRLEVTDFGADPTPGTGDDAPAIRRALAAAQPGDEVYLPAGVFDLDSGDPDDPEANLVLSSGVQLRGAGPGRTVLVSDFDGDDDSAVIRGLAVHDVVVSGLTVTSTYDGPLGTDTEDDSAGGGPMFGVQIGERDGEGSSSVLIEDLRVERFQRHGITVKASREVTVQGNEVADATSVGPGGAGYGIAIEGRSDQRDPEAATDSRHNVVRDNVLDGDHLRHAILLQFPTHNNLVADNVVRGSLLDAIDLHGEGEYLNEIRGNTVIGCDRAAIALGNSGGSTHRHGASGEGNWVHDNRLLGNQVGVLVMLGTPDTLIQDNRIVAGPDSEAGIALDDAPGTEIDGNAIEGSGPDFQDIDDQG